MSCSDPECPGCLAEKFVSTMREQGADPDIIIGLFFAALNEIFSDGAEIEVHLIPIEDRVVH